MPLEHLSLECIAEIVDEVPANPEVEEHFAHCELCRREYDALRQLVSTVSRLPEVAPPKSEWARIATGLSLRSKSLSRHQWFRHEFARGPMLKIAAALVVTFAAGLFSGLAIHRLPKPSVGIVKPPSAGDTVPAAETHVVPPPILPELAQRVSGTAIAPDRGHGSLPSVKKRSLFSVEKNQDVLKLPSGDSVVIVTVGRIVTPNRPRGLVIQFVPFSSLSDTVRLRHLAVELSQVLKAKIDGYGALWVGLQAISERPGPGGDLHRVENYENYKFLASSTFQIEKRSDGRWYWSGSTEPVETSP